MSNEIKERMDKLEFPFQIAITFATKAEAALDDACPLLFGDKPFDGLDTQKKVYYALHDLQHGMRYILDCFSTKLYLEHRDRQSIVITHFKVSTPSDEHEQLLYKPKPFRDEWVCCLRLQEPYDRLLGPVEPEMKHLVGQYSKIVHDLAKISNQQLLKMLHWNVTLGHVRDGVGRLSRNLWALYKYGVSNRAMPDQEKSVFYKEWEEWGKSSGIPPIARKFLDQTEALSPEAPQECSQCPPENSQEQQTQTPCVQSVMPRANDPENLVFKLNFALMARDERASRQSVFETWLKHENDKEEGLPDLQTILEVAQRCGCEKELRGARDFLATCLRNQKYTARFIQESDMAQITRNAKSVAGFLQYVSLFARNVEQLAKSDFSLEQVIRTDKICNRIVGYYNRIRNTSEIQTALLEQQLSSSIASRGTFYVNRLGNLTKHLKKE